MRIINMKTILGLVFLALTSTTHASTIQIDLGPYQYRVTQALVPFAPGLTNFNGQTMSLDFTFIDSGFIRLYQSRLNSFEIAPWLSVHGIGTLSDVAGTAYTTDANGVRNSAIQIFGFGSVISNNTQDFTFSLGYSFPLFTDSNGTLRNDINYPFDIYGLHIDVTLPSNPDFTIDNANLFMGGAGTHFFSIGPNLPENVNSLYILAFAFVMLAFFQKKCCT
jgi:hypothetical protein